MSEITTVVMENPIHGKLFVCEVANTCIQRKDVSEMAQIFRALGTSKGHFASNASRLLIGIDGYNEDTRELAEIAEVRDFIKALTEEIPWWFAILHTTLALVWITCIVPKPLIHHRGGGAITMRFNIEAVEETLLNAIDAATMHMRQLGIQEEDIETVVQNLSITAGQIIGGIDPMKADPVMTKAMRDYHKSRE